MTRISKSEQESSLTEQPSECDVIIGIDLGTTNSLVAVCDASGPRLLADAQGRVSLPSVVRYSAAGECEVVGHAARENAAAFPGSTIASVKRLMGRSVEDAQSDLPYLGYHVVEGEHQTARVKLPSRDELITPQEVSAEILKTLRATAEHALGHKVEKAVVTVPAYFDDAQRQATRDAGRIAGLDVVRIVNEPTAAALAYGIGDGRKGKAGEQETVAVYDLGGGTFDISILRVIPGESGSESFFQVLATAGDTHLGGDDADRVLAEHIHAEVVKLVGEADAPAVATLVRIAERAKIDLSVRTEAGVTLKVKGEEHRFAITREKFDELITPWADRSLAITERALRKAKVEVAAIDRVVLVGGSTRVPLIRKRVAELFETEPYTAFDPDQVVALGAAVQGAILSGTRQDALLLDVIPLSLGIETVGGAAAKIITAGSTVPARATEMFSTSVDGQTSIKLHVVQGEREMVDDCRSLGTFHLAGLPPMPAGIPQMEVAFSVDANGVLSVEAIEKRSGARAQTQVVPNHGLTREEVSKIEADSLANAREDMDRHRVADLIANSKLDLKWCSDKMDQVGSDLEPSYRDEMTKLLDDLKATVANAEHDWKSVDANTFYALKQQLDEKSIRLHEVSIAKTLSEE